MFICSLIPLCGFFVLELADVNLPYLRARERLNSFNRARNTPLRQSLADMRLDLRLFVNRQLLFNKQLDIAFATLSALKCDAIFDETEILCGTFNLVWEHVHAGDFDKTLFLFLLFLSSNLQTYINLKNHLF